MVPQQSTKNLNRPGFLWDFSLTGEDVRRVLATGSQVEQRWLVERILTQARWEEIWDYLAPQQVRQWLPRLKLPAGLKKTWERALEIWLDSEHGPPTGWRGQPQSGVLPIHLPINTEEGTMMKFPSPPPESILTPLQWRVLKGLFENYREMQALFLTGGTALAAFYFGHRLSEVLDLFTTDDSVLQTIPAVMADLGQREGLTVERVRDFTFLQQFQALDPQSGSAPLRIDFVKDIEIQFGERQSFGRILVDDPRNIGSNKICAVLGRTELKDFIDLYILLQHGYDFDLLYSEAQQKDSGLTPFWLAACLREVTSFSHFPNLYWNLDFAAMQQFFLDLADRLLESLKG